MHDLECMKMHDFLQVKNSIKPVPRLASSGFSRCMKIDLLIKKRAGSASPRGGGLSCVFLIRNSRHATSF